MHVTTDTKTLLAGHLLFMVDKVPVLLLPTLIFCVKLLTDDGLNQLNQLCPLDNKHTAEADHTTLRTHEIPSI